MSRFSRYDTDEERLPEGMQRVGYDADSQVYTFRDADGSYWESAPGNQYGQLTKVGEARPEGQETETFLMTSEQYQPKMSWFTEMKPFLNFLMLVILSLVLLCWFLGRKTSPEERIPIPDCPEGTVAYAVKQGDTCWEVAKKNGVSVDDILKKNADLDCEAMMIDDRICVPTKKIID
ncbi:peptidoglycan-binding domain-containing protein [Fusarium heterosporum]|uniref:Peptidoglycan-binding domain-containing protein n=1 Tax=Fusarium heterosporum TaxID=42747 RepID=A0A8H5WNN6_FUSHE|nr:peptidoglycan-binding domain-containing protein [Fusarium heterosporum]